MNDVKTYNPEEERQKQFFILRENAQQQARQDVAERIQTNPTPTEEENRVGCFMEMLVKATFRDPTHQKTLGEWISEVLITDQSCLWPRSLIVSSKATDVNIEWLQV